VNIGIRQRGRIQADSVINCEPETKAIVKAINDGLKMNCKDVVNPYQGVSPSRDIVEITKRFLLDEEIDLRKKFWDVLE
jgi:GDP/UDP-N,N'-diacetylbacillosamine 2-epimerase (hydrolysing)